MLHISHPLKKNYFNKQIFKTMATIKQISLIEPQMAIFVIKKLLHQVDDEAISQAISKLNDQDFEELVNILIWLGYEEKTINEILK